jgi:tetratricopeptide (TPR) repeat protein
MDNIFIKLAVVLLLAVAGLQAYKEWKLPDKQVVLEEFTQELVDKGELEPGRTATEVQLQESGKKYQNVLALLSWGIIMAAGVGFVVLKWVLPAMGDKIGETFYSSSEKLGPDRNAKAMSLITQGKYEDAIAEFRRLAAENPSDRFPIVEIAKLQQDKLGDVDAAMGTYLSALEGEWAEDDAAFFLLRLAEMHYSNKHDNAAAKELLNEVIQRFPGSRHAGNATHKLREIEEQEFLASRSQS